jgi:2-oxoisovalerate dehydrogenase E1 component
MLYTSLFDENPVLFFEHKKLYRSIRDTVPEKCRIVDLESAKIQRKGDDAVIITYGMGVHWALKTAESFSAEKDYSIEVLDLRSLAPIDWLSISKSLKKTGKVLLLQEPSEIMGPMSEISAGISENYFEYLDAPIMRCSSLNMPVPFNKNLENEYLASSRLSGLLKDLLMY